MRHKSTADDLTLPQQAAWEAVKARCEAMEAAGLASGDRMVFHGTSAMRAASILEHGFIDGFALTGLPEATGTHWGLTHWARWGADRAMEADDTPCIIAARLADVLGAGLPRGDRMAWELAGEGDLDVPWHVTLEEAGAFVMVGAARVPGAVIHGIEGLPLHPHAREVRARRLRGETMSGNSHLTMDPGPFDTSTVFAGDEDVDLPRCVAYRPGRWRG